MTLASLASVTMGLIVIPAGVAKAMSPDAFVNSLSSIGLIPASLRRASGRLFPIVEVTAGVALVAFHSMPAVPLTGAAMFLMFALVGIYMIRNEGGGVSCGCLGAVSALKVTPIMVAVNVSLACLAVGSQAIATTEVERVPSAMTLPLAVLVALWYWVVAYSISVRDAIGRGSGQEVL